MTPRQNDLLIILLLALQATLVAVIVGGASLGLVPAQVAWLAVLNIPIGVLLNQLKGLGAPANGATPLQQPSGVTFADAPIVPVTVTHRATRAPRPPTATQP